MPVINLTGFNGENRAVNPKLLKETVGTVSRNQKPGRGDFRPWRQPKTVATIPAGAKTIYRMGRDVASDSQYWLSWPSVVHAIRGFIAGDTTEKTFYTGDGEPKVTDNTMALTSTPYPTASRQLGIPAPATPVLVSTNTGEWTEDPETYFYVYTYVNDWGWESAPSPVSVQNDRPSDSTATLSGFAAPPPGNYGINRLRIYRTQVGSSGSADFFFLREVALGTQTASDDNRDLGEVLPTTTWLPAPSDLSYLTSLWNGMAAGISGGAVRFCEAYTPYAWPISYDVVPPDATPVALGVFGQTLLVLTTARPLVVAGSSPDSMDQQPLEFSQGCVAPRSVASMGSGVVWASEDGLCWYGVGGPRILTSGIMLREDWQAINPQSIIGKMYEGLYFGSYDDGSGRKGFFLDPSDPQGIYFVDVGYEALHFDELRDQLYVLSGTEVKKWDAAATFMTARFKSKEFYSPKPVNFSTGQVVADAYPVSFKLYADGGLKLTLSVQNSNAFRLPSGFMAQYWTVELESATPVLQAAIATSTTEISAV